ncbi:MAG: hypothetical protein QNK82_06120 [Akkermansiaceae bacterium]
MANTLFSLHPAPIHPSPCTLGQNKDQSILSTSPDLIATGNIGCLTQITSHLKKQGRPIPIRHTIQILRDAWTIPPAI